MAEDWNSLEGAGHGFLDPVYRTVQLVLEDIIQPRTLYDLDTKVGLESMDVSQNWQDLAQHYHGFLACVIVAGVLAVCLLIGGILYCCCCCCCKRPYCCCKPSTKDEYDDRCSCGTVICYIVFVVVLIAMFMGVLVMFVSSSLTREAVQDRGLQAKVKGFVGEIQLFVNDTVNETSMFAGELYGNLHKSIDEMAQSLPGDIMDAIEGATDATQLLDQQIALLNDVIRVTKGTEVTTTNLQTTTRELIVELEDLESKFSQLLPACATIEACRNVLDGLSVTADVDSLNIFRDVIQGANEALNMTLRGKEELAEAEDKIRDEIQKNVGDINNILVDVYKNITALLNDIPVMAQTKMVEGVNDTGVLDYAKMTEDYVLVWYNCMSVFTCVLLLIILLYLLGLSCSICDGGSLKGDPGFCQKSRGSIIISSTICLLTITALSVVVVSVLLFALGGLFHTEACRYFAEPAKYQSSLNTIDELIQNNTDLELAVFGSLEKCSEGQTLYMSLDMDNSDFSIEAQLDPKKKDINQFIRDIRDLAFDLDQVSSMHADSIAALEDAEKRQADFHEYVDDIPLNVTNKYLGDIISYLEEFAQSATVRDRVEFQECMQRLRAIDTVDIPNIRQQRALILDDVAQLEQLLRDIKTRLESLDFKKADRVISNFMNETIDRSSDIINSTLATIVSKLRYGIGHCGPVRSSVYELLSYGCVDILYPFNAYWMGLVWFLVMAIISMFVACKVVGGLQERVEYVTVGMSPRSHGAVYPREMNKNYHSPPSDGEMSRMLYPRNA